MIRSRRDFIVAAALLMAGLVSNAQERRDLSEYSREAAGSSLIYRNRQAVRYDFLHKGTYFWDSPEFLDGSISVGGKKYGDVRFNIDAFGQQLLLMLPDTPAQIQIPCDDVDWAEAGQVLFVNLRKAGLVGAREGLYEELAPGVYRRVVKELQSKFDGQNTISEEFETGESFFTVKNSALKRVSGKKAATLVAAAAVTGRQTTLPAAASPADVRSMPREDVPASDFPASLAGVTLPARYFDAKGNDTALARALDNGEEETEIQDDHVTREEVIALKGAAISADLMSKHRDSKMGVEKLQATVLTHVPTAFGEADVLKAVLTLPGVKTVGEASGGFNVRGGSADQNLILFGDCTIYNPNHMFGVFSAFDTDMVRDVELYKSSIPAKYGGRISSVLRVQDKDGNPEKVEGSVGLGLLTSRLHLEGPIVKGKTTFNLGGRITYSNWMMKFLEGKSNYAGGRAAFSDLTGGITHRFNDRNSIHAFAYWSRDNFSFSGDTTFRYKNLNASLKWRSRFDGGTSMELTGGWNGYDNHLDNSFNDAAAYSYETSIGEGFAKLDFRSPAGDRHMLSYGASGIFYDMCPGWMGPYGDKSLVTATTLPSESAVEAAVYVSDVWQPSYKFSVEAGLRYSGFSQTGTKMKFHGAPELRVSAKYSFIPTLSVKAGFNSMRQYIHLISNTTSISPMDTWKLCDDRIKPQDGWQAAGGLYWTVIEKGLDLSVEGYYKSTVNTLDYKPGAELVMNPSLADALVQTRGKAYGAELMAKKSLGKLTGWVSYTWSRSLLQEMEDRGLNTINGGKWYSAPYDKPHDFKFAGNYKFTQRYSISLNVDYSTGRPVTVPVGSYPYGGGYRLYYSERNEYRIPDYFRMDLAMSIEPSHYLKQLSHMSVTFGVYNVTGRRNAYSVFYTIGEDSVIKGHMLSVFASQIPYVNLNLNF